MYLPKMENNLPVSIHGGILYIKHEHAGGDSPSVTDLVKPPAQEEPSPTSNLEGPNEEPAPVFRSPSGVVNAISSPSHGKHSSRGTRPHRRYPRMSTLHAIPSPFADKTIRRTFLRKIYIMLTIQLGLTCSIICIFIYLKDLTIWVQRRPWFCYSFFPAILIMGIALACCDEARRKIPLNYILLLIFTIVEGTLLGSLAAFFDAITIMWGIGATAGVTIGLSIFTLQPKWDVTITSGVLLVLIFVVIIIGMFCAILQSMASKTQYIVPVFQITLQWTQIIYAAVGSLLFSTYLMVDTQLMLGKKHHYTLTPEEYIFAVLNVYIDIINMCLFMLQFVGFMK